MAKRKTSRWQSLKNFYHLYTTGLNHSEIERLLKRESVDVFSYYKGNSTASATKGFPFKQLEVVKEIFISFVMKLTPARRMFYGVALLLFIFAVATVKWSYAVLAFALVNILLAFELADKMLAKDELEIAREIQANLAPDEDLVVPGVEIAAFAQPAREVGGDYYDFIQLDDQRLAIIVGDVSGKGIPAALYATKLQTLFETLTPLYDSPKDILISINRSISLRLNKKFFMTAVLAIIDLEQRSLKLARAGHNPPIFRRSGKKEPSLLKPAGIGIGLDKGSVFEKELREKNIELQVGDILVFYTDGITEAMNERKEQFEEMRLAGLVADMGEAGAAEIKDNIVRNLHGFCNRAFLDDDATLVVLKMV